MCAMNPRLLRPILSGDPDALRYIAAVQQADGQSLEPALKKAITDFVVGLKQDQIWDAIKSCCILAGARTLDGALVPLVGEAPTNGNNNFTSDDYNRETGLKGDGSTTYLKTPLVLSDISNADFHLSAYLSEAHTLSSTGWVAASENATGANLLYLGRYLAGNADGVQAGSSSSRTNYFGTSRAGFHGGQGSSLSQRSYYYSGGTVNTNTAAESAISSSDSFVVFRTSELIAGQFSNSRIAFYSIGESLDLAALDTRVTALITAIGNAL